MNISQLYYNGWKLTYPRYEVEGWEVLWFWHPTQSLFHLIGLSKKRMDDIRYVRNFTVDPEMLFASYAPSEILKYELESGT